MRTQAERQKDFVMLLADAQSRLYGYILTLLPNREAARDVLQETNLQLWEKAAEFIPASEQAAADEFGRWACRIAHFKVLSHFRDRGRDRHLFDDAMLATLAPQAEQASATMQGRLDALAVCLDKLPQDHRQLIRQRYTHQMPVTQMATESGKTALAMRQMLFRVRHALMRCIERRLTGGQS